MLTAAVLVFGLLLWVASVAAYVLWLNSVRARDVADAARNASISARDEAFSRLDDIRNNHLAELAEAKASYHSRLAALTRSADEEIEKIKLELESLRSHYEASAARDREEFERVNGDKESEIYQLRRERANDKALAKTYEMNFVSLKEGAKRAAAKIQEISRRNCELQHVIDGVALMCQGKLKNPNPVTEDVECPSMTPTDPACGTSSPKTNGRTIND